MSRISRDTREALNSIMGYLTLAGEEDNVDQRRAYVKGSQDQVRYLLSVLNDVIDLSAMEMAPCRLKANPLNSMGSSAALSRSLVRKRSAARLNLPWKQTA